jgi:acetylornithine aminotransferase
MKLSKTLLSLKSYPFVKLNEAKQRLKEEGIPLLDFGVGEPQEITPEFIRKALADSIEPLSRYPLADGLPELRVAISDWVGRRFGVDLDAATQVLPSYGTKEAIFHLADVVGGEIVVVTTPGYPVPGRGALFGGKEVIELPLLAENGFLPDLDALTPEVLEKLSILWLNYPNNPTGAVADLEFYEKAAALARRYDFILASDEAYSEIYFGETPPASALQLSDLTNIAVFNTLSKRSSMPGYRSGFLAGDQELIAAVKRYRPNVGVAPQEFVQRAATVAWKDETHVKEVRAHYATKREALLPALESVGLHHAGGDATFFLWLRSTQDEAVKVAERLLEVGVVVAPGWFFGDAGRDYLRLALVPPVQTCQQAAKVITDTLKPASSPSI